MPRKVLSIYAVTPGSIWADLHRPGRTVLIEALDNDHAVCTTLTNSQELRPTSDGFAFVTATGAHLSPRAGAHIEDDR